MSSLNRRSTLHALLVTFALSQVPAHCLAGEAIDPRERPLVFGLNRIGDAAILSNPPDYLEHMYRRIAEAGGTCVRLEASTRKIEGNRGKRVWKIFDEDLALALKYKMEPVVLVTDVPAWASPTGDATHDHPYKDELLPEFEDFCRELAERTRGKVRYFQICNEQNGFGWHVDEVDGRLIFGRPEEYLPMLQAAYQGLKKGNPDCIVSMGSMDDAEGHAPKFLTRMYAEMEKRGIDKDPFDAISDHPYSDTPAIMREKLDALREMLKAHGDGHMPFWLTEYAWSTAHMSDADQAAKLGPVLDAMIAPAWSDVQMAIYLSIADFEMRREGMGLCDANLRPKPAYDVFQGASRFGAYPPFKIKPVFVARGKVAIRFQTLKPVSAKAVAWEESDKSKPIEGSSEESTDHRIVLDGLHPGKNYRYTITTTAKVGESKKSYETVEYELHSPGDNFFNGGMEQGFFAGVARGWDTEGEGFLTDYGLMQFPHLIEGDHAQSVFALAEKDHKLLDTTLSNVVAAEPGKPMAVAWSWSSRCVKTEGKVLARAAIADSGRFDPKAADLQWTDWSNPSRFWDDHKLSITPEGSIVRIYIQCRLDIPLEKGLGTATFALDNVHVTSSHPDEGG